jgi:hypothetical protein
LSLRKGDIDGSAFLNMADGGIRFLRLRLMMKTARMANAMRRNAAMTPPAIAPALEERLAAFWGRLLGEEEELDVEGGSFGLGKEGEGTTIGPLGPAIAGPREVLDPRGALFGVSDGLARSEPGRAA